MLNYCALSIAMLIAAGKLPAGSYSCSRTDDLAMQSLAEIARACDSAHGDAVRYCERIKRSCDDFLERIGNGYFFDEPFNASSAVAATAAAARARVLIDLFGPLFSEIGGLPFTMAAQVVTAHASELPIAHGTFDNGAWIAKAAPLLALAKAMHEQEQALQATRKRIAQEIAEAEALARVEAKNAERKAAREQRAADRKAVRA